MTRPHLNSLGLNPLIICGEEGKIGLYSRKGRAFTERREKD